MFLRKVSLTEKMKQNGKVEEVVSVLEDKRMKMIDMCVAILLNNI